AGVVSHAQQKQEVIQKFIQQKENENRLLEQLMVDEEIHLCELGSIKPVVRRKILDWIAKAIAHPKKKGKTENGRYYRLYERSQEMIEIASSDGYLRLPDWVISFKEGEADD